MAAERIAVYLEVGAKRTVAGAIDWPGWCRTGRDDESALAALVGYASRYAKVLSTAKGDFRIPAGPAELEIVQTITGDGGTDFGVPGKAPAGDDEVVDETALRRLQAILADCWQALREAARGAGGHELKRGPRGGGRELEGIVQHVIESNAGYLRMIGHKVTVEEGPDLQAQIEAAMLGSAEGLSRAVREGVPPSPRGGARWTPRYYARRAAWHVLDHAWEIEDRVIQ